MSTFAMKNEPLYGTSTIIGITDIINELTAGVGVTVDGVLLKDSIVSVDTINDFTTGVGVTVDGVLLKDSIVSVDTINELSTGVGVIIDGVLLKDSIVNTDTINEQSTGVGVTIDGVLLKDSIVSTDTINELSTGVGVTIDGVLLKDSIVSTDTINELSVNTGVTIEGVLLKDSIVSIDNINELSTGVGVTIDGVLVKDNEITVKKININDDTNLSVDTANADVSKWMVVNDTVGTTDYYVPLFTAANTTISSVSETVWCQTLHESAVTFTGTIKVNFATPTQSSHNYFSYDAGTDILTINKTGVFKFDCHAAFHVSNSGFSREITVFFVHEGVTKIQSSTNIANASSSSDYGNGSITYILSVTTGDEIYINLYANTGSGVVYYDDVMLAIVEL
jgi:hypothetical protein